MPKLKAYPEAELERNEPKILGIDEKAIGKEIFASALYCASLPKS